MRKKVYLTGIAIFLASLIWGCSGESAVEKQSDEIISAAEAEENVPISAEEIDEEMAYAMFLGLDERQMIASVDPGLMLGYFATEPSKTGDEITLNQLTDLVSKGDNGEALNNSIYYTYFKGGSRKMMAVNYESIEHGLSQIFVFCYYDNTLHLSYNYSCKSKETCGLHKSGYIEAESAMGASEYVVEKSYIDAAGKYRTVVSADKVRDELIAERTDEKIFKKVYKKSAPEIEVVFVTIGEQTYLSYNLISGDSLNDKDRKFILKTSEEGFNWLISEEIESKVADRMEELGLTDKLVNSKDVEWSAL